VHDADTAWKQILRSLFEPFLEFYFPEIHEVVDWSTPPEFIDTGLERLVPGMARGGRVTDLLAKLRLRDGITRWLLVHVEVQGAGESTDEFDERVFDCHFLIQHRHQIEAKGGLEGPCERGGGDRPAGELSAGSVHEAASRAEDRLRVSGGSLDRLRGPAG
jgi:hypothetical protein